MLKYIRTCYMVSGQMKVHVFRISTAGSPSNESMRSKGQGSLQPLFYCLHDLMNLLTRAGSILFTKCIRLGL